MSQPSNFQELNTRPRYIRHLWVKVALWATISLTVAMLLLMVVASILLKNAKVHRHLVTTIEEKASDSLGVQVQLQNFTLHPFNLSLDLYGLVVHGADPYSNPPVLQLDHAAAGVRIVSVLHQRWYLDHLILDHPVVQIFADSAGHSNIPKPKSSESKSTTNVFDLGVRHVVLDHGEFYYNDRKAVLEADLHNLDFRTAFNSFEDKYSGTLSYEGGHLQSGNLNPVSHSLQAAFSATRKAFVLNQAKLVSGSSRAVLTATIDNYESRRLDAHYDVMVDAGDVQRILNNSNIATGLIHMNGSLLYQSDGNRPAIEMIIVDGYLDSHRLSIRTPTLRTQIDNISARYSLSKGDAAVQELHAHLLGGQLTGSASMKDVGGDSKSVADAVVRGVSLADLRALAPSSAATREISIGGVLNADAEATWGKTIDNLVLKTNFTIRGSVARAGYPAVVPIEGAVHASYKAVDKILALKQSSIGLPNSVVTMDGIISNSSSLALDIESTDLREVDSMAMIAAVPTPGQVAQPLGLGGTAVFSGVVHGTTMAPHLTGHLQASNLQVRGTNWLVVRTDIDVDPSVASLQNAVLQPASGGRIGLGAKTGLHKWSFTNTNPIQLDLTASQINVADLAKVAGVQTPITGSLGANLNVHGTELSPIGQGDITILQAKVQGEPIQSAKLTFVGSGEEVRGNLAVRLAAGAIDGVATVRPRDQSFKAQLTASGLKLDQLQTLKVNSVAAIGSLSLKATGEGLFKNPRVDALVEIPRLEIQRQTITGITLQANIANHVANATLKSEAINTAIQARAKVNLTGNYFAEAAVDTQSIPLQPLVAIYAPAQAAEVTGQTELHATLRGPLQDKSRLEAHVTIPMLKMAYGNAIQLAAASPIHADFVDGVLTVQKASIKGTDTDLDFQGTIPTVGDAPVSLLLVGTVNLQIAQLFSPDVKSSGQLRMNINSYGARTDPNVQGQVELVDASFANGDLPIGLEHGNGVLTLTKDRLNITKFEGVVGGGTLTAQGGVAFRPAIQFNMGLAARGIRLLYPQGMREGMDADLAFSGTPDDALLGGQVRLNDLSFTPDFDLTSFAGQFSGGATPPPAQGFTQNLRLNIGVTSTNGINLVSRTLSVNGTANLRVQGTVAEPVILGRINLNGGDLIFNGDRFVLDAGTIQFVNPAETQPVVNVSVDTTIHEYNIHLRFNGPVDQLRTNYASDPSLPAADIINLLAFGKTNEAGIADPATPGNQAAESLVASQVSSQITSRVSKIAGISQLSIDPVLGGGQTNPGARITVQQRVTGNLYVTFSSDVTSTQNQVITGQYRLSPRVSVSATRDQNGGFALDTQIKKSW